MEREKAIAIAHDYGLEEEIIYEIDVNGCTPEEALYEWDLLWCTKNLSVYRLTEFISGEASIA